MSVRGLLGIGCAALVGCSSLIALDNYRPCTAAAECANANDAGDSSTQPDTSSTACASSDDCALPNPVCSANVCVGVSSLISGTAATACVLLKDGTLWCWGSNDSGQLGRGTKGGNDYRPAPVSVIPSNLRVVGASLGLHFGCALTNTKHVYCWGTVAAGGGKISATSAGLQDDTIELSANGTGACARQQDGVYCWGENTSGDLGCDADAGLVPIDIGSPRLLYASKQVAHVAVGLYATCLLLNDDNIRCYGSNEFGGLGDGNPVAKECNTSVTRGSPSNHQTSLVMADFASCVQDENLRFFCWGANRAQSGLLWPTDPGQLWATPQELPIATYSSAVAIGWRHSCALTQKGEVTCWGQSDHAQTGILSSTPVGARAIAGLSTVVQIAAYRHFSCALQKDGQVMCWGSNETGAVGPGAPKNDSAAPIAVSW